MNNMDFLYIDINTNLNQFFDKTGIDYSAYPGHALNGKNRYKKLYHFTSFASFQKIWNSKNLKFSNAQNVNDSLEKHCLWSMPNFRQLPIVEVLSMQRWAYKQISLTMDYDSYIKGCMSAAMWGYYAEKGNGVCIEIDFEKLEIPATCIFSPIKYTDEIPYSYTVPESVITQNKVADFLCQIRQELFFTKHLSWKGENEFRILSKIDEYLNIKNAISAIYLTSYNSEVCLKVESLVKDDVPVKCVFYTNLANRAVPACYDTKAFRRKVEHCKKDPKNCLNKLQAMSYEIYQKNCDDWDKPLLLPNNPL